MKKAYDFDDIFLVPRRVSHIRSREEVDTSIKFGSSMLDFPLIAPPMKDVCDGNVAKKLQELGCLGIIHRFCSIDEQCDELDKCVFVAGEAGPAAAIGINESSERFEILRACECKTFCIDNANGASSIVENLICGLLAFDEDIEFIVGNVASAETYEWVAGLPNVIGVRVGIAGGCFIKGTKVVTKKGKKSIDKIKVGDEVLTHKGRFKKVVGTSNRLEKERIFDVNGIKCTGNHRFYVVNKKHAEVVNENNLDLYAEWVSAEELSDEYFLIKMQE